jgi:hypothetical protein
MSGNHLDDLPELLLPTVIEDLHPDPLEDEVQVHDATPTSALTAEATWQPSTMDESALRRELAEADKRLPVSTVELRSLTGRIFDSIKDGVSYLSPFKPSISFVEHIRETKSIPSQSKNRPSSFANDPPQVSTESSKSRASIEQKKYVVFPSKGSPTTKLRSLIESMTESSISERKLRDAEAREHKSRIDKLEQLVQGLATATAQTVETAKMVNESMTSSGSQHSTGGSFKHTASSSHEGEIDESNRYGRILASEAKKGLSLDVKFDGSPKNRLIFINKLSARSSEVCWNHDHHDIITYDIPSAGTIKSISLLANHGGLSIDLVMEASTLWSKHQIQRAKHMYHCIHDSLSDATILQLAKYQAEFDGNGPVLFMYVVTKLAKPTLAITEEQKLKRGLSEESLRKKIHEFNSDVSKFETYIVDLQLEIAQWNSQARYQDLEHSILKALGTVKSSLFLFDVRVLNKEHTKLLKQYDIDGIETNKMTSHDILASARNDYLEHIADGTWKLDILEQEESRVSFVNTTKKLEEQWQSTTKHKRNDERTKSSFISEGPSSSYEDPNKPPHWRNQPPEPGTEQVRDHKNGRTGETSKIFWCEKCGGNQQPGRWNSTHATKDHNSDFYKDKQPGSSTTADRNRGVDHRGPEGGATNAKFAKTPAASDMRMSATLIAQLADQQGNHDEESEDSTH